MSEPPTTEKPAGQPAPVHTTGDGRSGAGGNAPRAANKYRDRPSDDGIRGDGAQEPNSGFPHNG